MDRLQRGNLATLLQYRTWLAPKSRSKKQQLPATPRNSAARHAATSAVRSAGLRAMQTGNHRTPTRQRRLPMTPPSSRTDPGVTCEVIELTNDEDMDSAPPAPAAAPTAPVQATLKFYLSVSSNNHTSLNPSLIPTPQQNSDDGIKELLVWPSANRVQLSKHRAELGMLGVEDANDLEVSRQHSEHWKPVSFYSSLPASPGSILFFRRKGVKHLPGYNTFFVDW